MVVIEQKKFIIREFRFEVQRRPEGPLANSHAREGVEQAIKLIPKVRRTGRRFGG